MKFYRFHFNRISYYIFHHCIAKFAYTPKIEQNPKWLTTFITLRLVTMTTWYYLGQQNSWGTDRTFRYKLLDWLPSKLSHQQYGGVSVILISVKPKLRCHIGYLRSLGTVFAGFFSISSRNLLLHVEVWWYEWKLILFWFEIKHRLYMYTCMYTPLSGNKRVLQKSNRDNEHLKSMKWDIHEISRDHF